MGDKIEDHIYSPDYQAQGDCRVCGHGPEAAWHVARVKGEKGQPLCNRSCERVERVSAALATQLSRALARNAKYAIAMRAAIATPWVEESCKLLRMALEEE